MLAHRFCALPARQCLSRATAQRQWTIPTKIQVWKSQSRPCSASLTRFIFIYDSFYQDHILRQAMKRLLDLREPRARMCVDSKANF